MMHKDNYFTYRLFKKKKKIAQHSVCTVNMIWKIIQQLTSSVMLTKDISAEDKAVKSNDWFGL